MEIKQAEAAKKAAIGRNDAQKEVALSNAELAVTQANADKQAGEATAKSEAAITNCTRNCAKGSGRS